MARVKLVTSEQVAQIKELVAKGMSHREIAERLDVGKTTVSKAKNGFYDDIVKEKDGPEAKAPFEFESSDEPIDTLICQLAEKAKRRRAAKKNNEWMRVPVKMEGPYALFFVGDPHLDSPGCAWDQLLADIEVMKRCPNALAINLGDQTDNWVGFLMKKYADSDVSMKDGRRLVKWLFQESGIPWWLILMGNHDKWHFSVDLFGEYARPVAQSKVWDAKLTLYHPKGPDLRLWAAHDFPGRSQWHGLHGPLKASKMAAEADIYACGDKHNWAIFQYENSDRRTTPTVLRARGYKSIADDFAEQHLGLTLQDEGGTLMCVVNPLARTRAGFITPFADLEQGTAFLESLL